jgi:hypothetical protein
VLVAPLNSDTLAVTTSRDAGGYRFGAAAPLFWPIGGGGCCSTSWPSRLLPGETFAYLFFVVNARPHFSFDIEHDASIRFERREGAGSAALPVVDPSNPGIAVGAGNVGAGRGETVVRAARGIAGGVGGCLSCEVTWDGPGAPPDSWKSSRTVCAWLAVCVGSWEGRTTFAGPAGRWSWAWSGAWLGGLGEAIVAAWAPIGDAWHPVPEQPARMRATGLLAVARARFLLSRE